MESRQAQTHRELRSAPWSPPWWAKQNLRAATGLQRGGLEMHCPEMKMGSHKGSWQYLHLVYLPTSSQSKVIISIAIFDKCPSNLLNPFGKGDPAMTPDKSFLLCQKPWPRKIFLVLPLTALCCMLSTLLANNFQLPMGSQ